MIRFFKTCGSVVETPLNRLEVESDWLLRTITKIPVYYLIRLSNAAYGQCHAGLLYGALVFELRRSTIRSSFVWCAACFSFLQLLVLDPEKNGSATRGWAEYQPCSLQVALGFRYVLVQSRAVRCSLYRLEAYIMSATKSFHLIYFFFC